MRACKWEKFEQQQFVINLHEVCVICVLCLFQEIPKEYWTKVCVVFDMGHYVVYVNAANSGNAWVDPVPVNSHSDATLGFVEGKEPMKGYFDDVSVYQNFNVKQCLEIISILIPVTRACKLFLLAWIAYIICLQ